MPSVIDSSAASTRSRAELVSGLPPSLKSPSVVQTYRYVRAPLPLLDECTRRFGDMFTLRLVGPVPWVFISSPPLVKRLFTAPSDVAHAGEANASVFGAIAGNASVFTMDESAHLDRRRLLLPQFHGDRMRVYFDQIRDIAVQVMGRWKIGEPFAMSRETQQMTLHAIIGGVFGVEIRPGDTRNRELVEALTSLANDAVGSSLVMASPLQRDWGRWSPWGRVIRIIRRADEAILGEIRRRRSADGADDRHDILSLLVEARYEDGGALTDRQIRDELVVMLMAGHETTGTALAWAFERVLSLPDVEQRIRQELGAVTGSAPLTAAHLPQLEYLDAVVKESLRIRPIMPAGGARLVRKPFELGGYLIPPGNIVVSSMYLLHRRPELYPDPDAFKPERFLGKKNIDPYEWIPFGGGIRRCLGYAFALFEMKTILASVLSSVRLRIENPNARCVRRGFFLAPEHGPRVVRTA